ncbi:hypothetical protein ACFSL6_08865 [Paenibacillus thailandensis]|uniref:Uncharacterized protein n=1 Tax=Paenibacillus thailandensis TaxID=393250 RepID=A0ABW5QT12_9BACL
MTPEEQRRIFQKLKSLSNEKFWVQMNVLHSRAYAAAQRHYREAMFICLTPKQREAVEAKAKEIREQWDGMAIITTDKTDAALFYGIQEEDNTNEQPNN